MIRELYTKVLERVNSFEYQRGISKKLRDEADKYSDILNKFPKGDMGLVPDEVTKTDEYKKALSDYKKAFKKERDFNAVYSKKFKKEIRKRVQEDRDKKTKAYREAKKLKAEEDYQTKLKEEEGIAHDFLNTLAPQRRGSAKKTLEKSIRVNGVVKPQKDFINELVAKGFAPKFSEWTEWSKRKGEDVKKSSWELDGYSITKTEADFAKYLISNKVTQDSINSIETEDKHITIGELDITIETQAGTIRRGTDENGKDWSNKMVDDYGYFNGTHGNDGDEIDVFVSSDADIKDIPSMPIFYLKQNHQDGTFDEDKFILGVDTQKEAEKVYYRNYESGYKNSGSWHKIDFGKLQGTLKKLSKIYISKSK